MAPVPSFKPDEISLMFAVLKHVTTKNVNFAQVAKDMEGSCGKLSVSVVTQRWDRFSKKHWKANSNRVEGKQGVLGRARVTKSGVGKSGGKKNGSLKQGEKVNAKAEEIKHEDGVRHEYEMKQVKVEYNDNEENEYYDENYGSEEDLPSLEE